MAFPVVQDTRTTNGTTASATPSVILPVGILSGDLLVILFRTAIGTAGVGWPSGWTELVESVADSSDDAQAIGYRWADGNEGANILLATTSAKYAAIAYRISGAANPATQAPEVSPVATGTSATPNPAALTPTGGAKDYLWLWLGGWEGEQTSPPAGNPTNYATPLGAHSGTAGVVATNVRVASAQRNFNAASEDPNSWTISASDDWTAWTLAVHPAPEVTAITVSDSGAGNDIVGDLSVTAPVLDSARATDLVGSLETTVPVLESSSGIDLVGSLELSLPVADSMTGTDTPTSTVDIVPPADSGIGSDVIGSLAVTSPVLDSARGTDIVNLEVSLPVAESGAGTDTPTSTVDIVPPSESGIATDAVGQVLVTAPVPDSAFFSELLGLEATVPVLDSAAALDSLALELTALLSDTMVGADVLGELSVVVAILESPTWSDTITATDITPPAPTEDATVSQAASVAKGAI